ncbi:hypothetical protein [Phenylobacterium sp.]|uniref:hypothetical protein n=1 Tax=Phenylobacterium sp. TaxID=1871053 RepID=UPI0030F48887
MTRIIAVVLAVTLSANALFMLGAPLAWYDAVPGVRSTGAFNPHFVRDIGAAYLVAAMGLAWFAWRPVQGWPALVAGALFLALHSGIHLFDASCSASPLANLIRDFPGVFLPTLLAGAIAVLRRPKEV